MKNKQSSKIYKNKQKEHAYHTHNLKTFKALLKSQAHQLIHECCDESYTGALLCLKDRREQGNVIFVILAKEFKWVGVTSQLRTVR